MFRRLGLLGFALLLVSSASYAEVYDVAGKSYDFTGVSVGSAVAHCGPFSKRLTAPVSVENTLSLKFGEIDETGGLLQFFDDSLLAAGALTDYQIRDRKGNTLFLQRAGTVSPLESGNELRDKVAKKLKGTLVNGVEYTGEPKVKGYSNKIYIKKDLLKLVETIIVSAPAYPKNGCTTTFKAKRKLYGVLHIEPSPP
jgi:hypothetical protein